MKPYQIFLFFIALFGLLAGMSLIFPREGIRISEDYTLSFPTMEEFFEEDTTAQIDLSAILESTFDIDSIEVEEQRKQDSIMQVYVQDSIRHWQLKLHYANNDKSVLFPAFRAFERASTSGPVRIMHYGDSQIEGDRISGYLRHKLQNKFGGNGPGLLAAVPLVRSAAIEWESSDNWKRYTMYGKVDSLVTHSNYGPLATFGRFTPLQQPVIPDTVSLTSTIQGTNQDTTSHEAWLKYSRSSITFQKTKLYNRYRLLFGNLQQPLNIRVHIDDSLQSDQLFNPADGPIRLEGTSPENFKSIHFEFTGSDSPDVYGVSLESLSGIHLDNIAMRGSSGTLFRKMDKEFLRNIYNGFPIKMMILQFGGNVMPYIGSQSEVVQYGKWFELQMVRLKELIPGLCIVVIGPSDMGTFVDGTYTPYPLLPEVRDALKEATFRQGGAYWDMMEAMGGKNSMKAWVEANPSLASSDYVHFNLRGASKIAQMFYNALIEDYNEYKQNK